MADREVSVKEIPSFRVMSHRIFATSTEELLPVCKSAACPPLTQWASMVHLETIEVSGMSGLELLHADWTQRNPVGIHVEECLMLGQDIEDFDNFYTKLSAQGKAGELGLSITHTPGGLFAVIRHHGDYSGLKESYEYLIHEWLPKSQYKYVNGPIMELYIADNSEKVTDVCCPIEYKDREPLWGPGRFSRVMFMHS